MTAEQERDAAAQTLAIQLGGYFRISRIKIGMTEQELAEKVGVSVRWLRRFERGDVDSTLHIVSDFAFYLGVEIEFRLIERARAHLPTAEGEKG